MNESNDSDPAPEGHTPAAPLTVAEAMKRPEGRAIVEPIAALAARAHSILVERLIEFGNSPSAAHREALGGIVGLYAFKAAGNMQGRHAVPASTGMGKTQSIVALAAAMAQLGRSDVTVLIAAQRAEALCDIKRDMIAAGVPESWIGLVHSLKVDATKAAAGAPGFASLPMTQANDGRPLLLVTHQRIKGGGDLFDTTGFQGKPRSLTIWDEGLIVTEAAAVSLLRARGKLAEFSVYADAEPDALPCRDFLCGLAGHLQRELERQQGGQAPQQVHSDMPDEGTLERFRAILRRHDAGAELHGLMDMAGHAIRIVSCEGGGVIRYTLTVPPELSNVVILDASYPIDELGKADPSIVPAPSFCESVKLWDRVTMHHLRAGAGRSTVGPNIGEYAKEVAALVATLPPTEAVLIFTFLDRDGFAFRSKIEDALRVRGIDLDATVSTREGTRPRIVFRTWGQHTSDSAHAYCTRLVFAGVLQRDRFSLGGHWIAQSGNPSLTVTTEDLSRLVSAETANVLYQALSRGSCRRVDGDFACEMHAYLIHRDKGIRQDLQPVTPGLQWRTWVGNYLGSEHKAQDGADAIASYLGSLMADASAVALKQIKTALAWPTGPAASKAFQRARVIALEDLDGQWRVEGQRLVRAC